MVEQEKKLSAWHGVPFIIMGRSGSYGSAGRHYTMRERRIEADIVEAGIDALKTRYGVTKWALGGHSGGGILTAEMLNTRTDLACAIMSSASGAFRAYLATHDSPDTNNPVVLDPIASVKNIPKDAHRRVFDIYDPRDKNVKLPVHKEYDRALEAQQVQVEVIALEKAFGPEYHDMVNFGEMALGWCAAGKDTATIINMLAQMPNQIERKTN
jgi:pimeloyl-ACP methyl ester carboxylesterase